MVTNAAISMNRGDLPLPPFEAHYSLALADVADGTLSGFNDPCQRLRLCPHVA